MNKIITITVILISLILHLTILRIEPFSSINLILIISLVLYERFDFPNSVLIVLSLFSYSLIDQTKSVGFVLLQFFLCLTISEILLRIFSKRILKLVYLGDLLLVTSIFYIIELIVSSINTGFSLDLVIKILISLIFNSLATILILNMTNVKRKNRLEMPNLR